MSVNLQSLIFVLVVLFTVLLGRTESVGVQDSIRSSVTETSVTAEALNTFEEFPKFVPPPPVKIADPSLHEAGDSERVGDADVKADHALTLVSPETKELVAAPEVSARVALVKQLGYPDTILEKNILKRWPMASVTKLMTAVVARESFIPDLDIELSDRAILTEGHAGNFSQGEVYSAQDLTYALLMLSSNDAAVALAEKTGYQEFINRMRRRAFDLGMNETAFFDPSGLSVLNQSTASDLEKLANYIARKHPAIFEMSSTPKVKISEKKSGKTRVFVNTNKFVGKPDFVGGKTGYTEDSNGNLISLFHINDVTYVTVVMGSDDRFGDTEKLYRWLNSRLR